MAAPQGSWRIGALAEATGLTVRTLHYYDGIGLLSPSLRSGAGHRMYVDADVQRLYRICALRRLGFSLTQIATTLDDESSDLASALTTHLNALDLRLEAERRLRTRIAALLAGRVEGNRELAMDLLEVLEDMAAIDAGVQRRISILVYSDLEAAHDYLVRTFGLGPGELARDADGHVVHAELQAGDGVLWLHREAPEFNLASPRTLGAATGMVAVMVEDVDAHYRRAVDEGATIRYAPVDQPYGYREYSAVDGEGHLWSFMKALV